MSEINDENKLKDYYREIRVRSVPRQMKRTIEQDRKQKGISESDLVKSIIDDHYQKCPLKINPYFLED